MIFLFPVVQIIELATYANTRETWPGKIGTFLVAVPIVLYTTLIWASLWTVAIYLTAKAFGL